MAHFGLKFSDSGEDVGSAEDKDLVYSTKFSTLKLYSWDDTTLTTDGGGDGTREITHSLGYAPAFFTFNKCTASWSFMDGSSYSNAYVPDVGTWNLWADDAYHHAIHAYSDSSKFYFQARDATASKTYNLRYYLLADLAEDFSGSGGPTTSENYGLKISKPGVDVKTAQEYELAYSTKYKALQYHNVSFKTHSLTLPGIWASCYDTSVEEGTYVDINHGLGYPPLFLAFFESDGNGPITSGVHLQVPFATHNSIDLFNYSVAGFCDSTRVRLSFYRNAIFALGTNQQNFTANETITLRCYIFTEDLSA